MKIRYIFILSIFVIFGVRAQEVVLPDTLVGSLPPKTLAEHSPAKDSLSLKPSKLKTGLERTADSKLYKMTYLAVPLFIAGGLTFNEGNHFQNLRNQYIPKFRYHYDDYLQYLPAAVMLGLKVGGVEGRSSWGRMLVSDAFSTLLMASVVNGLKYTVKKQRPDGSSRNSFPSGHTATAFMAATMLHKEYGLTRSPWYSIGGYAVATATAVSRQMNNRHWISDVLVGAGIGILSTELGYYLADLIFKEKGLRRREIDFDAQDLGEKPSFVSLYMGMSLLLNDMQPTYDFRFNVRGGTNAGIEGAWYITRNIGVGGRFTVANMPMAFDSHNYFQYHPEMNNRIVRTVQDPFDAMTIAVGPYFSYPITPRWLLESKLLMGYSFSQKHEMIITYTDNKQMNPQDLTALKMNSVGGLGFGTGLSIRRIINRNLGVGLFVDYNLAVARFAYNINSIPLTTDALYPTFVRYKKSINYLTLGVSVSAILW